MKKQLLFIFLFVVLGIVVGLFWSGGNKKGSTPFVITPTPTENPLPVASGVLSVLPTPKIEWTKPFSFPSFIHEVKVSSPSSLLNNLSAVTSYFQLSGSPKQIVGARGTTFIWSVNNRSLSINNTPLSVSFSSPSSSSFLNNPQLYYENAAIAYLKAFPFQGTNVNYKIAKTVFLRGAGTNAEATSITQARLALCYVDYLVDTFPLYTDSPAFSQAVVGINSEGTVVSLQMLIFPSFITTEKILPVKPYESLLSGTQEDIVVSRYITQSENETTYEQTDVSPQAVSVSSVSLGRYFDAVRGAVFPVFFITGDGVHPKSGKTIVASFFARASE